MRCAIATALRRGFTLIEALIVTAIIGVLVALTLPAVQAAREASRRSGCQDNLRQMGIALYSYQGSAGSLPIGYLAWKTPGAVAPGWSWAAQILPQLEQAALSGAINIMVPADADPNRTALATSVAVYNCPSDTGGRSYTARLAGGGVVEAGTTGYAASHGTTSPAEADPDNGNGLFLRNRVVRDRDIRDGASATIALGERSRDGWHSAWAGALGDGRGGLQVLAVAGDSPPGATGGPPGSFGGPHPGLTHFLMADGSVRPIKPTINLATYRALATRSSGDLVGEY